MTDPFDELGAWDEPDPDLLAALAHQGAFAADHAVLDASLNGTSAVPAPDGSAQRPTPAELTGVAVRAALRMLLANGLVTARPISEWPDWILLDPPKADLDG